MKNLRTPRERPILFSAPMVRALLDGSKTQTRRVCKAAKSHDDDEEYRDSDGWPLHDASVDGAGDVRIASPYGMPGDRLWVRETLSPTYDANGWILDWHYAADKVKVPRCPALRPEFSDAMAFAHLARKGVPSIHMPRWASRITLEVVGVRVERLQEISRGDAMDEGCPFPNMATGPDPRHWYADLWQAINGADSWATNPWVWVVEFRKSP